MAISARLFETGFTLEKAAFELGISRSRFSQLWHRGEIAPAGAIGKSPIFAREDVLRLSRERDRDLQFAKYQMTSQEAAHAINIPAMELRNLAFHGEVKSNLRSGVHWFAEADVRRFAEQTGRQFGVEPSDPEERAAYRQRSRMVARVARRQGRLKPQPCEQCGSKKSHGHHDDYTKPLEVRWLCIGCHAQKHLPIGPSKSLRPKPEIPRKKTVCGLTHEQRRERLAAMVALVESGRTVEDVAAEFDVCVPYLRAKAREINTTF
jgi:hypothetical protein